MKVLRGVQTKTLELLRGEELQALIRESAEVGWFLVSPSGSGHQTIITDVQKRKFISGQSYSVMVGNAFSRDERYPDAKNIYVIPSIEWLSEWCSNNHFSVGHFGGTRWSAGDQTGESLHDALLLLYAERFNEVEEVPF